MNSLPTSQRFEKFSFCYYYYLLFLGPHLRHMEVPRLGVEPELQPLACATATARWDPSCVCDLHHSSQQCWIPDPLSEARDRTHILMDTSRILFHCVTTGTLMLRFRKIKGNLLSLLSRVEV